MCNWCSYAGADLAGISRIKYAPNLRIIRVLCSGRVDPYVVLTAFEKGADGVLVAGCHPGDCHYISGNYQAEKKIKATWKILSKAGIDQKRLGLEWISAAEGQRFADVVNAFTQMITELGPLRADPRKIATAKEETADFRIRWLVGREKDLLEEGNVFGEPVEESTFEILLDDVVTAQYVRTSILTALKDHSMSAKELAEMLELPSHVVVENLIHLRRGQKVQMVEGHPIRYEVSAW
ncbi:MAG: hydrogenase iron-sulfur subunit [Theionarchaea archaeon]|nr:hydrogenase iron-sulfur subunit [Theionarchaea archaeon]MBU7020089.1 hydrogenase iron-sulfur subunit [Theionarchaea archaeon]